MERFPAYLFTAVFVICVASSLFAQVPITADQNPCMPCGALQGLKFPELTIEEVEAEEEGAPHCRVVGTIGKEIKFELLLPEQWNARCAMKGNGAFAGSLQNSMAYVVDQGFATVVTNTGHESSPLEADWALNNMERQLNFGHLAVHRTAVVAKAIMERYYQAPPAFSYFIGCSRGGGEALMEAQRYPEDFDGIVAGAPSIDWPGFGANAIRAAQIMYPDPENFEEHLLSSEHLQLLRGTVLKQCDEIDGLKDNILNDPTECRFGFCLTCLPG